MWFDQSHLICRIQGDAQVLQSALQRWGYLWDFIGILCWDNTMNRDLAIKMTIKHGG